MAQSASMCEVVLTRSRFWRERRLFSSSRRSLAARVGLVFFRRDGACRAAARSSPSRSCAATRFICCVLCFCDRTLRMPALLIRAPKRSKMRSRCMSDRHPERATSKQTVTRVRTRLTFWPPGPLLVPARNSSASVGIRSKSPTSIIPDSHLSDIRNVYNAG